MKKLWEKKWLRTCVTIVGLAILVVVLTSIVRAVATNYILSVINKSLIYFIAVASINLMLGFTGYLNFSTIPFMGLSAFITADLALAGWSLPLAMLIGTLACGVLSYILGFSLLRLKGPYFVFGSMGLVYIGQVIYNNFVAFSGGPNGRSNFGKLEIFGHRLSTFKEWFPVLLVIALFFIWFTYRIKNTALGRGLMATRDDETAACTLGIDVYRSKRIIYTIACLMCGFAGALLAVHNGMVSASLFNMLTAQRFVIMAMLGGILSPIGSFFGAFIVSWLPEVMRFSSSMMNILFGVMIILLMIFMPMGVAGIVSTLYKRTLAKIKARKEGTEDVSSGS